MANIWRYKGFVGSVNFSSDDRIFFGKIEGINDLAIFERTTMDELEKAFKFMIEKYIQDCERERKLFDPPC